jgi:hypothetical protein
LLSETDTTEPTSTAAVHDWFARFEDALAGSDEARLSGLFHAESYWRDLMALTWDIGTVSGADAIGSELKAHADQAAPARFALDPGRTQPRRVRRSGTLAIEAIFKLETAARFPRPQLAGPEEVGSGVC